MDGGEGLAAYHRRGGAAMSREQLDTPETHAATHHTRGSRRLQYDGLVALSIKLERERNAALAQLAIKEKAHEVPPPYAEKKSAELIAAHRESSMLAKLAADTPQFYNPLVVLDAKNIRDRVLAENAAHIDRHE